MPNEQIGFERIGMVVIERGALFEAQVVAIAVIAIVIEERDLLGAQAVDDPPDTTVVLPEPDPPATPITNDAMAEIISA